MAKRPAYGVIPQLDPVREERADGRFYEPSGTPLGQAQRMWDAGAGWFQVEIPHSTITGVANALLTSSPSGTSSTTARHAGATDLISQIEAEGWALRHANFVYVMTGQSSRDKFIASGQQTAISGDVIGIYLFQRTDRPSPI